MENTLENDYKNRIAVDGVRPENSNREGAFLFQLEEKKKLLLKDLAQMQITMQELKNNAFNIKEAMRKANGEESSLSDESREILNAQFMNYIELTMQNIKKLKLDCDLIENKLHNVAEEIGIVSLKSAEYEPPETRQS